MWCFWMRCFSPRCFGCLILICCCSLRRLYSGGGDGGAWQERLLVQGQRHSHVRHHRQDHGGLHLPRSCKYHTIPAGDVTTDCLAVCRCSTRDWSTWCRTRCMRAQLEPRLFSRDNLWRAALETEVWGWERWRETASSVTEQGTLGGT